ncbi:MAG: chromate transporter [Rhodospirillales bacterium 20-60-12]|nr:MAG: chromate transporter [Rhodospirillales bacterium 20-60-12]HQT67250.1 chromate transporter [Acetobacteraceae bacterium]
MTVQHGHPSLSYRELFIGFFAAGVSGFGGVLPFARRLIVERRGWLSAAEFTDLLALCQFLPGPNIVNFAFVFGARHHGLRGSLVAVVGLLAAPFVIVLLLGGFYTRYGQIPIVHHGFIGLAAAASGLMLGTGVKIALPLFRRLGASIIVAAAFLLVGILQFGIPLTILLTLPFSLFIAWRWRR